MLPENWPSSSDIAPLCLTCTCCWLGRTVIMYVEWKCRNTHIQHITMQSLSISSSFQLCKSKTPLSFRSGKQLNSVMYQFVVGLCSDCCCAVVVEKLRCEVKCGVPTCYGGQSWVIQTAASPAPACCNSQLQRLGVFPSASKREANKVSLKVCLQQHPSIFDVRQQWTFATFNIGSVQSSSSKDAGPRLKLRSGWMFETTPTPRTLIHTLSRGDRKHFKHLTQFCKSPKNCDLRLVSVLGTISHLNEEHYSVTMWQTWNKQDRAVRRHLPLVVSDYVVCWLLVSCFLLSS